MGLTYRFKVAACTLLVGGCAWQHTAPETVTRAQNEQPARVAFAPEPYDSIGVVEPILKSGAPSLLGNYVHPVGEPEDLWAHLRSRFSLVHHAERQRVAVELEWLEKHPAYIERVVSRARRYLHYILGRVEARGIPGEIALLPVVESAFDPFAYSHGRAAGLWQFIPATATHYGLRRDWWIDERRDVIASTRAALDYLERLNGSFDGDWLLALAAYNSGEGTVWHARRNAKRKDFWSLRLPPETRTYVPRLLALAILLEDPGAHGVKLKPLPDEPYFDIVDTGSQIDLQQAAHLAGVALQELYWLNPGFNQFATHPDGPYRLLLPAAAAPQFTHALARLPAAQRVAWKRYTVKSGDTLSYIAKRNHVSTSTLRRVNTLHGDFIRKGQALMIPTAMGAAETYVMSESQRHEQRLARLSRSHAGREVRYRTRSGDSLWEIARRYGVGVRELAHWNSMATTDVLGVGRELAIYVPPELALTTVPAKRPVVRKIGYTVRRGDSLSKIANRFRVSISEIVRWNAVNPGKYLQPGQMLTLFVNVTKMAD